MQHSEKFIITGGPGSGKSTLINELSKAGYTCFEEVSRKLIKQETAKSQGILPWENLSGFAELVLEEMIYQSDLAANVTGPCFFDRAIPDIFGYMQHGALPVPDKYFECLNQCSYNPNVFILPPWPEIFVQDSERWQTFDEAMDLYFALRETYTNLGFELWELPTCDPMCRVEFIQSVLEHLQVNVFN